jgi:DNA-binding transcriptional MocR family regulator
MLQTMLELLRDRLEEPTSRSLADAVSAAIRDEALREGDVLPPIRTVAEFLKLSPTTVSAAWALLARAGAIHTDGRRGTKIARSGGAAPSRYRRALPSRTSFELDLATGIPDPALLPDLGPALRSLQVAATPSSYLDDPVLAGLAEVLRADWPYPAERITVVDGAMDALDLLAENLLRFGDRVVVEHPCFPPLLDLLDAVGVRSVGVSLDDEGMIPGELQAAVRSGVRAVFLQPRAQNPTGASLTERRAAELCEVLRGSDTLIIEDDSAGAIATSAPISLGASIPERTLHVRSFSKSHGPDLRLAAIGGPAALLDPVIERRLLGQGWTSRLLQSLLLELLTQPGPVRQVRAARAEYARRRTAVVKALLARGVEVSASDGINLWLPVADEAAALVRLASRGIGAAAGGPFASKPDGDPHLRVTVGLVASNHDELAAELAEASRVGAWSGPR